MLCFLGIQDKNPILFVAIDKEDQLLFYSIIDVITIYQMETKSQSSGSQEDNTNPSSSTLRYLRDKHFQQSFRKGSVDSQIDRPNFCFNLNSTQYSVMRVYIDAMHQKQIRLYYTKFTPKTKTGQICIIHGYGQSTDEYLTMAQYFTKRGYVINMIDMRGFGYSGGSRVNEPTTKVLADIETLLRNCCERDLPTFIIAHGLGAMFLNALLQQNRGLPISGVINITPLINFVNSNRSFGFQRILLKVSPPIFNNLLVHNMINPTALAKDPLAIKAKIDSIFWETFITLKMADEYEQVGEKLRSEGYKFSYPTLFCCGSKDLIQDLKQIKAYFNSLSSQDKQMIVFKDGYHQLHNDHEADELMLRIHDWIETRRNKIKWKQIGTLQKDSILKKNRFWHKLIAVIGILVSIIFLIKKLRDCWSKVFTF